MGGEFADIMTLTMPLPHPQPLKWPDEWAIVAMAWTLDGSGRKADGRPLSLHCSDGIEAKRIMYICILAHQFLMVMRHALIHMVINNGAVAG